MLNKEICKKCTSEQALVYQARPWHMKDDEDWDKEGVVHCFNRFSSVARIEDGPPESCHYFTEQFLYHDATEKKKVNAK